MHKQQTAFENTVGKGEIARNEQFLLFPQCFLLNQIMVPQFVHIFNIISLFAAELEEPKICKSGKGLTLFFLTVSLLMMTKRAFVNSVDQDQTVQNSQSDLWIYTVHIFILGITELFFIL